MTKLDDLYAENMRKTAQILQAILNTKEVAFPVSAALNVDMKTYLSLVNDKRKRNAE